MQSRLAAISTRTYRVLIGANNGRGFAGKSRPVYRCIYQGQLEHGPDVHRSNPEWIEDSAAKTKVLKQDGDEVSRYSSPSEANTGEGTSPLEPPRPPHASAKLKSTGVNERLDPNMQQRRSMSSHDPPAVRVEEVVCAGLDGSPWPEKKERGLDEQQEDDVVYFKHHKASALSEIEVADTRKPITRATDGTGGKAGAAEYGGGKDLITFRPEQLDTAEDSLRRAAEIWRQNAMRGDPDAPHSRVLRALRGESF